MVQAVPLKMNIRKFTQMLRTVYLNRRPAPAILLRGAPGMSKSALAIALCREMQAADPEFGACYMNASNGQAVDWMGWPLQGNGVLSANSVPTLFQPVPHLGLRGAFPALHYSSTDIQQLVLDDLRKAYPRGIIIVDEASKVASEADMATLAMLAHEGRTGMWGVPVDGWLRLFIANRQEDNSNDLPFPATFDNRVATFDVHANYSDVQPYWTEMGMHPWFMGFAAANTSLVLSDAVPAQGGQFSTVRSWTEAEADVMAFLEHECGIQHQQLDDGSLKPWPKYYPDEKTLADLLAVDREEPEIKELADDLITIIASRCGVVVAGQFADYVAHMSERPTYDQIVDDPQAAPMPNHGGVLHYVIEMLLREINLADMDEVIDYMERPGMPKALGAIFCQRMMAAYPFELTKKKSYMRYMNSLGLSARLGLD